MDDVLLLVSFFTKYRTIEHPVKFINITIDMIKAKKYLFTINTPKIKFKIGYKICKHLC